MKRRYAAAIIAVFTAYCFFIISQILSYSATFDEPMQLAAGVSYWKDGKLEINEGHPPLSKYISSSFLVFLKGHRLDYSALGISDWFFADEYYHSSRIPPRKILLLGRIPSFIFGILSFFTVFLILREMFEDPERIILGLLLYTFTPVFLTVFSLANTDYLLLFSSFLLLYIHIMKNISSEKRFILLFFFAFLGAMSKFSGLLLFIPAIYSFFKEKPSLRSLIPAGIAAFAITAILYRFSFSKFLSSVFLQLTQMKAGAAVFFLGRQYPSGTPLFIFIIILKMSAAYILFWIIGAREAFSKKHLPFILLALLNIAVVAVSKKQLGMRYFIPAYPFLFFWAVCALRRMNRTSGALILLLMAAFVLRDHPNYLSHFNELVPVNKRHLVSSDSDLDWGQNLALLSRALKKFPGIHYISYFGTDDPSYYHPFLHTMSVSFGPKMFKPAPGVPEKGEKYLCISATNLTAKYYDKDIWKEYKTIKPVKTVNGAFFIYRLPFPAVP